MLACNTLAYLMLRLRILHNLKKGSAFLVVCELHMPVALLSSALPGTWFAPYALA
jgi:hypothetical protein